ncbi:hypothetical protein FLK61_26280 [Paenalkalicoccus suaedae]|uniref:Uncharacterized protein n=1 Tax=Paenalkalicoccus suaedae TaxID=2592382 RepID=A0A859FC06_9BACI|nr:alanine-zipper protein [Paenalkalicoccus suaedae]QKS70271.1 hypothetical protein FLK61_26280 [Paenalkalicoccus suaedae]
MDSEEQKEMRGDNDLTYRLIDEMSLIRADIRELMTTMAHFNQKVDRIYEDMRDTKTLASEASSQAESAENQARKALDKIEEQAVHIERLYTRDRENKTEIIEKIDEQKKEQVVHRRWLIGLIATVVMGFTGFVLTIILTIIGG